MEHFIDLVFGFGFAFFETWLISRIARWILGKMGLNKKSASILACVATLALLALASSGPKGFEFGELQAFILITAFINLAVDLAVLYAKRQEAT